METFYITFGQKYRYETHPACAKIDQNAFLRVEAGDELEARHKVIDLIGRDWAMIYTAEEFAGQIEEYGLWDVTRYVMLKAVE